jgi:hypothetical protein
MTSANEPDTHVASRAFHRIENRVDAGRPTLVFGYRRNAVVDKRVLVLHEAVQQDFLRVQHIASHPFVGGKIYLGRPQNTPALAGVSVYGDIKNAFPRCDRHQLRKISGVTGSTVNVIIQQQFATAEKA